ncbi:dihydrolipoamide acetyltransferase family protein [Haloplanus pelagicus]|jgi:pyruvate dehydrogenase E2 component (dihydrolipoamide acetyltransferase)|uniref:dihydrolipoamide acetyltransferase family protein n=1 Tax=Haloplanus pelagicus TaxID=2949995 RepID=UPI00203F92D1|nr:dihydrolipoamide acetyltransferase family protein [Haloplanus sp. HW8-1]
MAYVVRMPKMGVEMETGVLLDWVAVEGESVDEGNVIAEIESEKTTAEVTARKSGVVRRTLLDEGAEVAPGTAMAIVAPADADVDDLLATVEDEGVETDDRTGTDAAPDDADWTADAASEPGPGPRGADGTARRGESDTVRATPKARRRADETGVSLASVRGTGPKSAVTVADVENAVRDRPANDGTSAAGADGEVLATPRARKLAHKRGVTLGDVRGTGPHGSIRADDVDGATTPGTDGVEGGETPVSDDGAGRTVREERSLSGMRSTIARRLGESWEAPHVTVDRTVEVESVFAAAADADDVVSVTDVLLLAVSETLAEHPEFNATFEDGVHCVYEEHNVGIAVDLEDGLVTPVLRDVRDTPVTELAHERGVLTDRVRNRRHDPADLRGGTFTVSNLGPFGVDSFTPIINPPQVAILGVGTADEEPRQTDRGIEFRKTMTFSLSFDHRVVDGADAARFLETLASALDRVDELVEG